MKNIIRLTYALTCALLMQGCCASKPPVTIVSGSSTEADSTNTTIHERIVTIHDTVTFYIPVESHSSVGEDSSHLETEFATSDAWIDSVGKLHHNIDSKPQEVPVPVDVHVPVADTFREEAAQTVTTIKEKEKKDRAVITVNTKTIQDGLVNMGFLVTQEYYFTQVETYSKDKNILFVIPTTSGFTYSYDGAVMAGVDFAGIKIETDADRKYITVEMPASEIQAVTIDKDTFKIYSEKDSLWNPLKLEDYNVSLVEFENAAKEKALASGILTRSDEQARSLVRQFISSLPGTAAYTVEFK